MALLEVQNEWKAFSLHESPFRGERGRRGGNFILKNGNPQTWSYTSYHSFNLKNVQPRERALHIFQHNINGLGSLLLKSILLAKILSQLLDRMVTKLMTITSCHQVERHAAMKFACDANHSMLFHFCVHQVQKVYFALIHIGFIHIRQYNPSKTRNGTPSLKLDSYSWNPFAAWTSSNPSLQGNILGTRILPQLLASTEKPNRYQKKEALQIQPVQKAMHLDNQSTLSSVVLFFEFCAYISNVVN